MPTEYPIVSDDPSRQAFYESLRESGQEHPFAEMCALQQPPGLRGTERAFLQRRTNNQQLDDMSPELARQTMTKARKAGINVNGKVYMPSVADKRGAGDPAAWVSDSQELEAVAKMRGLHITGSVNYKPPEAPPKAARKHALAPDIVQDLVSKAVAKNPDLRKKSKAELVASVVEKHAPKYKMQPLQVAGD